ncbi:MAG: hypothetical protein QM610_10355 [Chitinophagaceae bacterium]
MKKNFFLLVFLPVTLLATGQFTLYSWVRYKNTPEDLMPYLHPIGLSMQNLTAPDNTLNPLAMQKFAVSRYGVRPVVTLDIETWTHTPDSLTETINRYINAVAVFRSVNQHSQIGFYAAPPYQRYQWKNLEKPGAYKHWQTVNDSLKRFAEKVDIFFPSAYCRDTNTVNWEKYIAANVEEIREKYSKSKPIYFYIDPQYIIKDTIGGITNHQFIDRKRWRELLELVYRYANGAVIWTSNKDIHDKTIEWDDNMEWWKETKLFLKEKGLVQ